MMSSIQYHDIRKKNIMIFIITISEGYVNVLYCRCQKKVRRRKDEMMSEQTESLLAGMADAGCKTEEIEKAECILQAGRLSELTRFLKQCRCGLLERMHESQKRVDIMDYLIRKTEKQSIK